MIGFQAGVDVIWSKHPRFSF